MFDDHQSDQTQNTNHGTPDTNSAPTLGGAVNPNPTYIPPSGGSSQPLVVPSLNASHPDDSSSSGPVTSAPPAAPSGAPGDLEDIKRQALAQLSPLVGKLEQTPEEKYKTIMMMIQASDNQDLINEAYENAQKITDEKAKAEALLNIVNEINYFAQKNQA